MTITAPTQSIAQSGPLSEQQLLHYADPYYDMRSGRFQWSVFSNQLGALAFVPFVVMLFLFGYGTFLMVIAAIGQAHRLARLEGTPSAVEATNGHVLGQFYLHFAGVVLLKLLVGWTENSEGAHSLALLIYFGFSTYAAGRFMFHLRRAKLWKAPRERHGKVTPAPMATEELRRQRTIIVANLAMMREFPVFDADNPEVVEGWEKKFTGRLERLMQQGDAQTRLSWQQAVGVFNHASQSVDAARLNMKRTLAQAEAALTKYAIDPSAPDTIASRPASGEAPIAAIKRDLGQKLNYTQGVGNAMQQVVRGQMPWQFAAVAAAVSVVMLFINESKLLRQLKEMEGQLVVDASAARGDMTMVESVINTRLLPQLDGLIAATVVLENEVAGVREAEVDGSPAARERALRLSFSVAEGKQLLETLAGD